MFLQDEQTKESGLSLESAIKAAATEVSNMKQTIFDFETKFMKINREVLGQTAIYAKDMTNAFAGAYGDVVSIGGSLDDIANTFSSINKVMQSNTMLSSQQLTSFVALEKSAGLTADQMGEMVEAFDTIGYGVDSTIETLDAMATKARSLGLNVAQFMGTVAKNIKLVNAYNYKDGVEGFTRMAARAQSLRIDMTSVNKLAGDLLNPEKAIELAAEFQNLGGAIGALGDPFQLMNMAQNDMEGLQNAIVDAAKSSVMFNRETGKYQISATEMRRLRAQADALGMSYEDLANTAVKAKQEQQAMDELRFTDLSDEQKQLVSNLAQLNKNGELTLQIPGVKDAVKLSELSSDQLKETYDKLKEQQKDGGLDALGVAREQLGLLRTIAATLGGGAAKVTGAVALSDTFQGFRDEAKEAMDYTYEQLTSKISVEKLSNKIDESVGGIFDMVGGALTGLAGEFIDVDNAANLAKEGLKKVKESLEDVFNTGGGTGFNSSQTQYSRSNQGLENIDNAANLAKEGLKKIKETGEGTGFNSSQTQYSKPNQGLEITPTTNNVQKIEITDLTVNHSGTIRLEGVGSTINFSTMPESELRILSQRIKDILSPELLGN